MSLPVILAIAGSAALLAGLFGGGVKAKEIVVPKLTTVPRIFSSLTGLVLIGISIWVSQIPASVASPTEIPQTGAQPSPIPPTEVPPTQLPPTPVPQPTATFTQQSYTPGSMVKSTSATAEPNSQAVFVHVVLSRNMRGAMSDIEHPLSTDRDALLFITPNYNPPANNMIEMYNSHPLGIWYRESERDHVLRWSIVNLDDRSFFEDAAFNVQIRSKGENAFIHTATSANISGSWTVIDHPLASDPNALVFATVTWGLTRGSGNDINHSIGVWYTGSQWAIFNLDGAPMTEGRTFNVEILTPADNVFVHTATASNSWDNVTDINPLMGVNENKLLFVMPRGSPDGTEVNNDQPIGVWWRGRNWAIFNQNASEPMPVGAAFNVLILDAQE